MCYIMTLFCLQCVLKSKVIKNLGKTSREVKFTLVCQISWLLDVLLGSNHWCREHILINFHVLRNKSYLTRMHKRCWWKKLIRIVEPGQLNIVYIFRSKDWDEQTTNMLQHMKYQSLNPQNSNYHKLFKVQKWLV